MISPLFLPAIGFLLFFTLLNWRFSAILGVITSLIAFIFGPTTALAIFVGYSVLVLFFEPGTAIVLGATILVPSYFIGLESALLILFSILTLIFILLVFALSDGQKSIRKGFHDAVDALFAVLLTLFSTFVKRIELIGTLSSPRRGFESIYSWYPGLRFTRELREDFVEIGTEYVREGTVDIEKSPDVLAEEAREAYDNAGQLLSDGETNIALALVVVSFLPFLPNSLSPPAWLTPPTWTGAALSMTLLIAVGLRQAALDVVLYQDVTKSEGRERLAAISAWNQYMSNGAKILKVLAQFRAIKSISPTASSYYLEWAFRESVTGDGADTFGLISQWKELMCFAVADRQEISPREASKELPFSIEKFEEDCTEAEPN
jgi:hypothetical protein